MYAPKLAPLMAKTCEITKPGQSSDKGIQDQRDESVRRWLLFWAYLRLVVSVLWTGVLEITAWKNYLWYSYRHEIYFSETPIVLTFAVVALILQLVEFAMIVTFICAGVKKSASLYRAYYLYCILTLVIYIISVTLCLALDYDYGYYFAEVYLTHHFNEFAPVKYDALIFGVTAILDVCLEILLIRLIKRLINKYSYDEDITNCEHV